LFSRDYMSKCASVISWLCNIKTTLCRCFVDVKQSEAMKWSAYY